MLATHGLAGEPLPLPKETCCSGVLHWLTDRFEESPRHGMLTPGSQGHWFHLFLFPEVSMHRWGSVQIQRVTSQDEYVGIGVSIRHWKLRRHSCRIGEMARRFTALSGISSCDHMMGIHTTRHTGIHIVLLFNFKRRFRCFLCSQHRQQNPK